MPDSPLLDEFAQVAEVGELWQAKLIAGRLRESRIDAQIVDQTFHQEPLPRVRAFAVVRVLVPKAQEEEARRVIAEGFALPENVELTADDGEDERD
jgi:hypothetical protein